MKYKDPLRKLRPGKRLLRGFWSGAWGWTETAGDFSHQLVVELETEGGVERGFFNRIITGITRIISAGIRVNRMFKYLILP